MPFFCVLNNILEPRFKQLGTFYLSRSVFYTTCCRISYRKCPTTVEWPFTVLSVSYSNTFLCYFLYDFLSSTLLMLLRKTAIITKYHENNLICNPV